MGLLKSNKSISRKDFFWPNSIFCHFKNGQKSIFELGKNLKMPKMQFHEKKFDFTSFLAWTFLIFLASCVVFENMTFFTVPRGCRCGISQWTRLCFIIIAFDGWSSSCRFAQDKNSFAIISHSIYLGCGHTYPVAGCQVCQF